MPIALITSQRERSENVGVMTQDYNTPCQADLQNAISDDLVSREPADGPLFPDGRSTIVLLCIAGGTDMLRDKF
jgi:hypothetical protein